MSPSDVSEGPSAERYRQILETAPDAMVVVGADERIIFVNVQTEKLFGYERARLIGESLEALIPERFRTAHKGHVARFFGHSTVRPMGSGLELYGRRADGTEVPIEVSLSPVHTAGGTFVSAAIRDITERKQIEAAAKLNADRLSSAVESIQDPFGLFDGDDRLVLCNSAYRRVMGELFTGTLIGRSFSELLSGWLEHMALVDGKPTQDRSHHMAEYLASNNTFDVQTSDGRNFRVSNRRTLEGGTVQTIWDLTDDVRREHELREARAAAEAASAAKSEFLSSMSHELRTPLNAILGFAQLLRRDRKEPLSGRHTERVDQILKGGEHLLRLIDDILDLSRIEAGAITISTEPVGVAEVLDEVAAALNTLAARNGIALELVQIPPELPVISADRTRFSQIVMNFGSNAIKYNRPGGKVTFTVLVLDDEHVRVSIKDTGIGIPADKQDKLFQPFQRAGQETGPIEGTGIGLVITKRLAELMHGSVGFRSVAGEGSDFWVDMPVHVTAKEPSSPHIFRDAGRSRLGADGQRLILYVEDNPANVRFIEDLLGAFDNIELITAPTAEIGVELARQRQPAVVIMDINLPGMSGLEALRTLQQWPETKQIPVIALTAAASERDRQRGEQAGFYRYLTKPVRVNDLEAALEALLVSTENPSPE